MEQEFLKAIVNTGSGAVIALFMLVGLYKIANRLGTRFIDAQVEQAEALGRQAQSMEGLTQAIQDSIKKDNSEHREMLVLLRFIAQQQHKHSRR
jgi:hypothetical protein